MAEYRDIEIEDLPNVLGHTNVSRSTAPAEPVTYDEFDINPSKLNRVLGHTPSDKRFKSSYKGPSYPGASVIDPLAATILKAVPFGLGSAIVGDNGEKRLNDVLDYYGPYVSVPAETAAGIGKAGAEYLTLMKALGVLGSGASKLANSEYGAPVVKVVSKVPGAKALGRGLTSTNPYVQAGTLGGTVGTGVTAANVAAGNDPITSVEKGLATGADVAAYTLGGRLLPSKVAPFAGAGYEAVTSGIGRAMRGEDVLNPYNVSQDLTRGALFGRGIAKAGPTEPAVKTSPAAKGADVYKEPVAGAKGSTKVLLKNIKNAPKKEGDTLLDLDIPENQRFFKELTKKNSSVAGDLAESKMVPKKNETATIIQKNIKEKVPHIQATDEAMQAEIDRLGAGIGPYTEPIREAHRKGASYIPKRRVDRILGTDTPERKAFDNAYNRTSLDTWGEVVRPNEGYDSLVVLDTKSLLSDLGRNNNKFYHANAADKVRNLFGKGSWVEGYKEHDKLWSDAVKLYDEMHKFPTGSKAQARDILRTIQHNADPNVKANVLIDEKAVSNNEFLKPFRDELARYNYYAKSENALKGVASAIGSEPVGQQMTEALGAKLLAGRFADWLVTKTGIKRVSEAIGRHTLDNVVENLGNLPVEQAVKALTAKHGTIKNPAAYIPALYDAIKELPKTKEKRK